MVSAARLGQPLKGNQRIRTIKGGGLITTKNLNTGGRLGQQMMSRLSGKNVSKVGGGAVGKKGSFVLANTLNNSGKVLIRTAKPNPVKNVKQNFVQKPGNQFQQQHRGNKPGQKPFLNNGVIPHNDRKAFIAPRQQPYQQQQQQNRNNRPNQMKNQNKQLQHQQPQKKQQFKPKQESQQQNQQQQQRSNQTQQQNETKLALDIINILLEDKNKNASRNQQQPAPQRKQQKRPMSYNNRQPQTVYIQQPMPARQPVVVQQVPKTVYVDENGYNIGAPRRVVRQQQPVVVRRQAPVQVVRRPTPRYVQRSNNIQNRMF